jgi:hypothetical protein
MSKLTAIQNQYQGYVAASEAIAKINPGEVEVIYKKGNDRSDDGFFTYHPQKDRISLCPFRGSIREYVSINVNDIPALIRALREFTE